MREAAPRTALGGLSRTLGACGNPVECVKKLKTTVNLKRIPCVTGNPRVAELATFEVAGITVKDFWRGRARLHWPHLY